MSKSKNLTKEGITRAILDDLDLDVGGNPKNERDHDELIEQVIDGSIPRTEPVNIIYSTLRWLEDQKILVLTKEKE